MIKKDLRLLYGETQMLYNFNQLGAPPHQRQYTGLGAVGGFSKLLGCVFSIMRLSEQLSYLTWQGQRFTPRVQVWGPNVTDTYLFRVTGEQARVLCTRHMALPDVRPGTRRIWRIRLRLSSSSLQRKGDATPPTLRCYGTSPMAFLEVLGYTATKRLATYTLRHIRKDEAWPWYEWSRDCRREGQ